MLVCFFMIHVLICVITIYWICKRKETNYYYLIPAVICVPVCGLIMYLMEGYLERHLRFDGQSVDLDKLKIEDVKYKRIDVDEDEDAEHVVPLEEAMMLNNSEVKRSLLRKVLDRDPAGNINLLQEARMGTDTEITHYATTTMAEIQASYEKKLQELAEAVKAVPDNVKLWNRYRRELQKYIASGLITGNILVIYRRQLEQVLERQIELAPDNLRLYIERVENQLEQGTFDAVEDELQEMREKWPLDEQIYRTFVKYYWHMGQGDKIQKLLDEIVEKNIYLSHQGQEWFAFWSQKES